MTYRSPILASLVTTLSVLACSSSPVDERESSSSAKVSAEDVGNLALANVGGRACATNSLGGRGFESSCTGNGGEPEYWCADFVQWVWAAQGLDTGGLNAAAGSFYVYGQRHGTLSDTPSVGAAVVFDYQGGGVADHVAIVTRVFGNGAIETVSGDWNGNNGSEAEFSRTSSAVLNRPAYDSAVGSSPGIIGMTISGYIAPVGLGGTRCAGGSGMTIGAIDAKYRAIGGCGSILGVPKSNEIATPDGVGRYNVFDRGSIYWTERTGAFEVHGQIRDAWSTVGWEAGAVGYPISDELGTPDNVGRYNVFEHGSIYWTPNTGAHEVYGVIRDKWAALGWEAGVLGYPVSGEYAVTLGRQSDFEHGSITWNSSTNDTSVVMKP